MAPGKLPTVEAICPGACWRRAGSGGGVEGGVGAVAGEDEEVLCVELQKWNFGIAPARVQVLRQFEDRLILPFSEVAPK